jgi:hypothetical protein
MSPSHDPDESVARPAWHLGLEAARPVYASGPSEGANRLAVLQLGIPRGWHRRSCPTVEAASGEPTHLVAGLSGRSARRTQRTLVSSLQHARTGI